MDCFLKVTALDNINSKHLVPIGLDGQAGNNRSKEKPIIPANDDLSAINCWLSRVISSKHTYESYKREAERILLWSIINKQKPLSSLDMTDISEYRLFLSNPEPKAIWVGKKHDKLHPEWKPFVGALSERSVKHSDTVIGNLFKFLVDMRYLLNNPYSALPKIKESRKNGAIGVQRSFSENQWHLIVLFLQKKINQSTAGQKTKWIRTNMIIWFLYSTGMRIHELAKAKTNDFFIVQRAGDGNQIWLKVIGKGRRYREVPVSKDTHKMLAESYLLITGDQLPGINCDASIIPPLRKGNPNKKNECLTPHAVHKILKEFFLIFTTEFDGDPELLKKISQASAHWLRHTHGSHAAEMDMPLSMIRDNLGHSSISTTSQYIHSDQDERHHSMEMLGS